MKKYRRKLFFCGALFLFISGLAILSFSEKQYFFHSPHPEFNFGEISVKNGVAWGTHVFKIHNFSDEDIQIEKIVSSCSCVTVAPFSIARTGKENFLKVEMILSQEQYVEREVEIVLVPKNANIAPLRLKLFGRAAQKAFFAPSIISLGRFPLKDTGRGMTTLYYPAKTPLKKIISKVVSRKREILVKIFPMITTKGKTGEDGSSLYLHQVMLELNYPYAKGRDLGEGNSLIDVFLTDGTTYNLPVEWYCYEKSAFNVEQHIIKDDTVRFQIIFNTDIVGKIKDYAVHGNGLRIESLENFETYSVFTIVHQKEPEDKMSCEGKLVVITKDLAQHILPIRKL
jgi:hypothetical protein